MSDDGTSISEEVVRRPVTIADVFFLLNQQATVNQLTLSTLANILSANQSEAYSSLNLALDAHLKLSRRIDALISTGSSYVD